MNHVASERRDNRESVRDGGIGLQMDYGSCLYMPDRNVRNKVTKDEDLALCLFIQPTTALPVVDFSQILFVRVLFTCRLRSITSLRAWSCAEPRWW